MLYSLLKNSFEFFEFNRKLEILSFVEDFFDLHSLGYGGKKDKNRVKNHSFLANWRSLNEFKFKNIDKIPLKCDLYEKDAQVKIIKYKQAEKIMLKNRELTNYV